MATPTSRARTPDGERLSQLNPRQKIKAANASLAISAAQPQLDEASYECALVEQRGQRSPERELKAHTFHLRLVVAPKLAPFEFPSSAQVGMKVVLTCAALEGQQPISFVWLKDNQLIEGADASSSGGPTASSLGQVHQQQLGDKAPLGSSSSRQPQDAEYLVLTERAGDSEPGALLPVLTDQAMRIRQADDYSILSIDKLELRHSGRYTCSAQNEAARTSHSSQLLINGKLLGAPSFVLSPTLY